MKHQNLRALKDAAGTWHAIAKDARIVTWCGLTISGQEYTLISFPRDFTCDECWERWVKENGEP